MPVPLSVPPMTSSPGFLPTGMLSPVIMLSSTEDRPATTSPSTGTRSPDRTRTMSPRTTCSIGMSLSTPARTTRAVRGARPTSLRIASEVWLRARASRNRPSRISVMIAAEVS